MAATKTPGARASTRQRKPDLPPITVAKLEETGRLLEQLVAENQSIFIERGHAFKQAHRDGTNRPLTPVESAQLAAALARDGEDPAEIAVKMQESDLRAYDEPDGREILLAAGLSVAPAFVASVRKVVALVEMPAEEFKQARESDTLAEAINSRAAEMGELEIGDARKRASDAFAHYAKSAGFDPGEAWGLPVQAVWQALSGAMTHLVDATASSQLTGSVESTGGQEEMSSTTSSGPKPSS